MKREIKTTLSHFEQNRLYRQFSRRQYKDIQEEFGNMSVSLILSEIQKKWCALDMQEKTLLYDRYINDSKTQWNQFIASSSQKNSSKLKTPQKNSIQKNKAGTSKKKIKGTTAVPKQALKFNQQKEGVKPFSLQQGDSENNENLNKSSRTKKINKRMVKGQRTQYQKFYKFYYDKLSSEHLKWTVKQIIIIIKLLWRKKLISQKKNNPASKTIKRYLKKKIISGRMKYRLTFNLNHEQAKYRWRNLPEESKTYWKNQGNKLKGQKVLISLIKSSSHQALNMNPVQNSLSFLHNKLK